MRGCQGTKKVAAAEQIEGNMGVPINGTGPLAIFIWWKTVGLSSEVVFIFSSRKRVYLTVS